ncbi:Ppx/GppA phosphatase family-domain-containing protein [Truncatella angustata]|uniref:Ppx/GppA phosphatase family-domain-containing protein n=1 Tax=Truncatella angustata TaxID=152316 RepID=A0A9P9A0P4_9PEZI|nr:Ppx/GppA phosphatase family-domain-containing protein [Truncatella angustata]KAH6657483.1 Ppx/GppA phosphatase family-domain-containing protein [Truncatella angustata]
MASATDVITLENFQTKMPRWEPNLSNHLYALVDMGSNGIRFSISDLSPPRARLLNCLYRERAAISLFDALSSSSAGGPMLFPTETITQVSHTLARFKSIADAYGVPQEHISVLATEAMRRAENADAMLDAILEASYLRVQVLAPEVETLFGAMGARSSFAEVNGLFLDLGGGSVQMSYMNSATEGYEFAASQTGKSLPFGAARLINILDNDDSGMRKTAKHDLESGLRGAFVKLQQEFPSLKALSDGANHEGIDVYLCGGGFRGYGSMLMHNDPIQPYPIPAIGSYTVSGKSFKQTDVMRKVNENYDAKIHGMSKRRRKQFPAIATVVEALIEVVPRIRTVTFCSGGNREGALLMRLPSVIREARPLELLHQPGDSMNDEVIQSVINTMVSAVPNGLDLSNIPTVFNLGLGPLFVGKIWSHLGEPSEANAAYELHRTVTRDPSTPGLTHLARAVLGLTACARWGSTLGPVDRQLYSNLRALTFIDSTEANYWTDYFGAVASVLTKVCPAEPRTATHLQKAIRFTAEMVEGKKKSHIELTISISADAAKGIDLHDIGAVFEGVGKHKKDPFTVARRVEPIVVEHKIHTH